MNRPIEIRATFEDFGSKGIRAKILVTDPGAYPKKKIFVMSVRRNPKEKVSILEGKGDLDLTFDFFDDPQAADQWVKDIAHEVHRQYEEWYTKNYIPPDRCLSVVTPYDGATKHDEELVLESAYSWAEKDLVRVHSGHLFNVCDTGIRASVTCVDQGFLSRARIFRSLSNTVDLVSGDARMLIKTFDTVPQALGWVKKITDEAKTQYRRWYKEPWLKIPGDRRIEIRPGGDVILISHYQDGEVKKLEKTKEDKPKLTALHIRRYIEDMYENNIRVLYVEFNSIAAPCGAKISILPSKCAPRGLSCESMIYPDLHVAYRWAFPDERINDDVDWKDLVHCVDKIVYRNKME